MIYRPLVGSLVLLVVLLVLRPSRSLAVDLHVGPAATGTGDGADWANQAAWASVVFARGNTYFVADGTYGAKTLDTPPSGSTVVSIRKATPSAHGSEVGWSDGLGDGVALFDTASLTVATSFWEIDGVTGGGPGSWREGHGIAFTSAAGTAIEYVAIASGVSSVHVRRCAFTQTGDITAFGTGASAFYDAGELSDSIIEGCYVDNIGALPFFFRHGRNNIIQHNYLGDICGMSDFDVDQHCEAVVIHDMDDVHFRWNYVAEAPSSGGFVKNSDQLSEDVRIYGNTFAHGFPINCNTGPCANWRIFNNTFIANGGGPFGGDGLVTGLLYYDNIVFDSAMNAGVYGAPGQNWFSRISSLSCSTSANPTENIDVRYPADCDAAPETLDPFVASTGVMPEDLVLGDAIAGWAGTDVCALEACSGERRYDIDAFGTRRGADGVWDRGAYEFPPTGGVRIDGGVEVVDAGNEGVDGGEPTDGGSRDAGGLSADAGTTRAPPSGCDCSVRSGSGSSWSLALLLLGIVYWRPRG